MFYSCRVYSVGRTEINYNWNNRIAGSVFWRIIRVISGEGEAYIRIFGKEYDLLPGHFYLIPAFARHHDILNGRFELDYLHFTIEDSSLNNLIEDYLLPFKIESTPSLNMAMDRIIQLYQGFELTKDSLGKYEKDTNFQKGISKYQILPVSSKLESDGLIRILFSGFFNGAVLRKPSVNARLSKARLFIANNISEPINIEIMAKHIGMRVESLIRLFNKEYHITPLQYLLEFRINRAKSLLLLTNDSVKEIAHKCGFKDSSYFCKTFKKHTSVTPVEFRKGKGEI